MFLAVASEVFATQFYGKLEEKIVKIEDASPDTFKVLLRLVSGFYIYILCEIVSQARSLNHFKFK